MFSDPQRLNPGNISIIRTIVTPGFQGDHRSSTIRTRPRPRRPTATQRSRCNCDTAVFPGILADYDITVDANGTVTVLDNGRALGRPLSDGIDSLRNIERLQFADVDHPGPGVPSYRGGAERGRLDGSGRDHRDHRCPSDAGRSGRRVQPDHSRLATSSPRPRRPAVVNVDTRVGIDVALGAAVPTSSA